MNGAAVVPAWTGRVAAIHLMVVCTAGLLPADASGLSDPSAGGGQEHAHIQTFPPNEGIAGYKPPEPRRPATLRRLVRHFDFEEAERAPFEMPLNFYRYGDDASGGGARAQGFPPFGAMRLTDEVSYSGRWSFKFSLDGGSLAARVPTAVIPIMPMADYVVAARVRTEGLTNSRAQIGAWLHDARGNLIPGSRVHSEPIKTDGQWHTVSVHVQGQFEDAADLVLELALLQPRHFRKSRLGTDEREQILLEDVSGRAWFDDVTVWHVPRIELDVKPSEHDQVQFSVAVFDIAHEELDARLSVFDLDGAVLADRTFPAPRSPARRLLDVSLPRYGWYSAVLTVHQGETLTSRQVLDFSHAPPQRPGQRPRSGGPMFSIGLVMPENWPSYAADLPEMTRIAGADAVALPVLSRKTSHGLTELEQESVRRALDQLRRADVGITFALSRVPKHLADHLGIREDDVFDALQAHPELWRPHIDDLLETASIAPALDRWLLGSMKGGEAAYAQQRGDLQAAIANARLGLSRLTPRAHVVVPLLAEDADVPKSGEDERVIVFPYAVRPAKLAALVPAGSAEPVAVCLELPPGGLYSPSERVSDAVMRVLHVWRAGASRVWVSTALREIEETAVASEPVLVPLGTLAAHLDRRRFAGELALGRGLHAWILEGDSEHDALLVWRDRSGRADQSSFTMQLADGDVQAVDVFGNAHPIPLIEGEHTVSPAEMPLFIEGVSGPLVRLRSSFALAPSFIPAEMRAHEHALVLNNPWDMPVSGRIQLAEDAPWRITPRTHDFTIPANGTIELPVQIVLDRGINAGRKTLRAQVILSADGEYRLDLETEVQVGLKHVDLYASWQVVRNAATGEDDLVIHQYIRNTGEAGRAITADAFMIAPGVAQQRRLVSGLEPGELAIRSFRVPNGAAVLAGRTIRLGLASRDSPARLNLTLEIPEVRE